MKIWRYMDFDKFSKFISRGELYFCGARNFEDPFEGEYAWGKSGHGKFMEAQKKLCAKHGGGMPLDFFVSANLQNLKDISSRTYVSCWHKSLHESEAMWKLYCKNIDAGVVVGTTVDLVWGQMPKLSYLKSMHGEVKYVSNYWIKEYNPEPDVFFRKRISFEHEKEYRFVVQDEAYSSIPVHGKAVSVDLRKLVQTVRLSPFADPSMMSLVSNVLKSAGIDIECEKSEIETHPVMSVSERVIGEGPSFRSAEISLSTKDSPVGILTTMIK